jgi:hypothetical protein
MESGFLILRVMRFSIKNILKETVPRVRFSLCLCYPSFLSQSRKSLHLSQRWEEICMRWGCELQVAAHDRGCGLSCGLGIAIQRCRSTF